MAGDLAGGAQTIPWLHGQTYMKNR